MRHVVLGLLCVAGLSACGARPFVPQEYPLRANVISPFNTSAAVTVDNAQPATQAVTISSYGGNSLTSSLNAITAVMVKQTQEEIGKNSKAGNNVAPKTLSLKVNSLISRYIAFYFKSTIEFQVTLGNGQVIMETAHHTSGVLPQDLDGCIAEGVIVMLNDPRIRNYLSN